MRWQPACVTSLLIKKSLIRRPEAYLVRGVWCSFLTSICICSLARHVQKAFKWCEQWVLRETMGSRFDVISWALAKNHNCSSIFKDTNLCNGKMKAKSSPENCLKTATQWGKVAQSIENFLGGYFMSASNLQLVKANDFCPLHIWICLLM